MLYQNYKEKALDIDSDEDVESKEHKSDEKIVIQYKPLRSTWSQLSAVSIVILVSTSKFKLETSDVYKQGFFFTSQCEFLQPYFTLNYLPKQNVYQHADTIQ